MSDEPLHLLAGGDEPRTEYGDFWRVNEVADEDGTLDSLDLASPPYDCPDVFDRAVHDLLHGSTNVYFKQKLQCVTLGPERKLREPEGSQEWSLPAAQIFSWLHGKKGVESARELWVIDGACGADSRIMAALWDPNSGNALFSGIDVFSWLAPNISIRTVESVAPAVRNLTLVWDGCSRIVLEAWEADLKSGKLKELRGLVIMVSWRHRNHHEDIPSELSMFKEAVTRWRDIHIQELDDGESVGNTKGTGSGPVKLVGEVKFAANWRVAGSSTCHFFRWGKGKKT